jgi:hypothetical protein
MGRAHYEWIRQEFGREVRFFNQLCYPLDKSTLDIHEAIPEWRNQPESSPD